MSPQSVREGSAVLITGCSSGIGEACALDLAKRGLRVLAGVRNEADASRLRQVSAGRLEPLLLDVTDGARMGSLATDLAGALGKSGLAGLVNNAGVFVPGPWELLSTEELRRQLEVNVLGTHAVTRALLPLVRQGQGRIVLMGSLSGSVAPPYCGAYAASKHALEAMADSLRMELRPWRISVSIIRPAAVATRLWAKLDRGAAFLVRSEGEVARLYEEQMSHLRKAALRMERGAMPTSAVVRAVRHALLARRPKARYAVGADTTLAVWGAAVLPARVMDWFLMRWTGVS